MSQTVTVTIAALDGTQLYSQTVESLNLLEVINAVNKPLPPAAPVKKVRKDKGIPRKKEGVQP